MSEFLFILSAERKIKVELRLVPLQATHLVRGHTLRGIKLDWPLVIICWCCNPQYFWILRLYTWGRIKWVVKAIKWSISSTEPKWANLVVLFINIRMSFVPLPLRRTSFISLHIYDISLYYQHNSLYDIIKSLYIYHVS